MVVACPVALGGTSRIAKQEREKLSERFSAGFVCDCMLLQQEYGFSKKDHEGRDMSNLHLEEKAEGSVYGRWLCRQVQVLSMPWAKGDF